MPQNMEVAQLGGQARAAVGDLEDGQVARPLPLINGRFCDRREQIANLDRVEVLDFSTRANFADGALLLREGPRPPRRFASSASSASTERPCKSLVLRCTANSTVYLKCGVRASARTENQRVTGSIWEGNLHILWSSHSTCFQRVPAARPKAVKRSCARETWEGK